MQVAVTWRAWKAADAMTASGTIKMPPKYEVIMERIDELVIEILERASVNPKAIPPAMFPAAQEALTYQNAQASTWEPWFATSRTGPVGRDSMPWHSTRK